MNSRKPLVYLGIFAVLALVYYFYEYRGGMERAEQAEMEKKAVQFSPDSAMGFTIVSRVDTGAGADTVRLEKTGGEWRIVRPVDSRVDSAAVARLLNTASDAARNRVVEDSAADLAKYGLDEPRLRFEVTPGPGLAERVLLLGDKNPGETYIYARNLDEPRRVVLLNGWVLGDLNKSVYELRDKSLLEFDPAGIGRVVIKREGDAYLALEGGGRSWRIISPAAAPADPDSVDHLLEELAEAEAESVIDTVDPAGPAAYGLESPALSVELHERETGALHRLSLGARDTVAGAYYAARAGLSGRLFTAGVEVFDLLTKSPDNYRNMSLVSAPRDSIRTLGYTGPGGGWLAVRDTAGAWSLESPGDSRLDPSVLEDLLWELHDLNAERFVRPGLEQRLKPLYSLMFGGDQPTDTLSFAPVPDDTLYYAFGGGFPGMAVVDSASAARVRKDFHEVRFRKLAEFDTGIADSVRIERPESDTLVLAGGEGDWRLVAPRDQETAGWKVQNFFWDLLDVKFERILSETGVDSAAFGFAHPELRISIWSGDSVLLRMNVGDLEPGAHAEQALRAVRVAGDARTFGVDDSFTAGIPDDPEDFSP